MNARGQQLMADRVDFLLTLADDELILGWRNSEWTGIAPFLEEDVAFSSIAQNEIGHARALYELIAEEVGGTADELAFDRSPHEYRHSSSQRASSARTPTPSPSTGHPRSTGRRPSSSCAGSSGRARSPATGSTRPPTRFASKR